MNRWWWIVGLCFVGCSSDPDLAADAALGTDAAGDDDGGVRSDAGCVSVVRVMGVGDYCSISEAIASAPVGAVVEVSAGTFEEAVSVTASLTLRGTSGLTIIESPDNRPALKIYGADVVVESLILRGETALEVGEHATVRSSTITASPRVAVIVAPQAVAVFERVHIEGSDANEAISIFQFADVTLANSRINASEGVQCTGAILRVFDSTISGNSLGIYAELSSEVTVERTRVTGNMRGGIDIRRSNLTMRDSESSMSNMGDGLWLVEGATAVIERSTFSGNGGYGINCTDGADAQCEDNAFLSNARGDTNCMSCNP